MSSLNEIQQQFYHAIFERDSQLLDFIASNHAQERFDIYRQTVFENLRQALFITFPAIWKLLGQACADSLAYAFMRNTTFLPNSGCLDDWGEQFPLFLATIEALKGLPYLKDVAQYQWLKHLAYRAADTTAIDAEALVGRSEAQLESTKFRLLPSVFLYFSAFPMQRIEEVIENPGASEVSLNEGGSFALITRPYFEVLTFWIPDMNWYFFKRISEGQTLNQAYEKTMEKYDAFNLAEAIHFLLKEKLIQEIY